MNNLPKIRQNLDLKQRSISRVRDLKEFLYSKRASLTQEEIQTMVDSVIQDVMEYTYSLAWDARNEVYECRRAAMRTRMMEAFNDFYNRKVGELTVKTMEEVRYLYDIAQGNRYYNPDLPLTRQVENRVHF